MKLNSYRKLPDNLFGLIFWNVLLFLVPIHIVLGLLALIGVKPIEFNDEPTYGIAGILWALVLGPLMSLVTTLSIWILMRGGNLVIRLLTKVEQIE